MNSQIDRLQNARVHIGGAGRIGSSIVLALAGAAAGALYPALRAATYDPVVALAYE